MTERNERNETKRTDLLSRKRNAEFISSCNEDVGHASGDGFQLGLRLARLKCIKLILCAEFDPTGKDGVID